MIVPTSAGTFAITSIELRFEQAGGLQTGGRITVPQGSKDIKAIADITCNGGGLLQARWEVDGQILEFVTQQIPAGMGMVSIETHATPGLPTYEIGRHRVELKIINPSPGFNEPIIYYYASPGIKIPSIELITPEDNTSNHLGLCPSDQPRFSWQRMKVVCTYRFELFRCLETGLKDTKRIEHQGQINALTSSGYYTLNAYDMEKLITGIPYTWHVEAYQGRRLVASSPYRTVYFSPPPKEAGRIIFEYLGIAKFTTGKGGLLETAVSGVSHMVKSPSQLGTEFDIGPGETIIIKTGIKNDTNMDKRQIYVQFLVDGVVQDQSYISHLFIGQVAQVEGEYPIDKDDVRSHILELRASKGQGEDAQILASLNANLSNTEPFGNGGEDKKR
ncbi:MAG: hypothetical protein U9P49_02360 [Thermodesulfobacteriota bacterium]|nr:hypothetical protein [Thermodesulfobacteriota bacterium]